ncbi:MAG: hypothetical protein KatS3mg110_0701 [Pirellulaceae bacterium]|nr:MAG: hypothetical protein KatS3mg110_0701 [Pirellulaceae bacterium]
MCPIVRQMGLLLVMAISTTPTYSQERSDSRVLVERIVAGWHSRQKAIKSLRARATVDSFYGKGYASAMAPDSQEGIVPPQDVWYRDQYQSWDIDFAEGRFRKEFRKARVCGEQIGPSRSSISLVPLVYNQLLFADNYATLVLRPEEGKWGTFRDGFRQHVLFDYNPAFVIWPEDRPLLWCAGGTITGQWQSPLHMLRIDPPDHFVLHHRTRWRDHHCVILRVRNQQSRDSVLEFWVDEEEPHLIYRSQVITFINDAERIEARTDVEYQERQRQQLPVKWTQTNFWYYGPPGQVFTHSETFTIQQIEINTPLDPDLFKVQLKPGMGVIYGRDRPGRYVVDLSGKLVECRSAEQQQRIASLAKGRQTVHKVVSVVVGLTVAIALSTAGWLAYRHLVRRKVGVAEQ